MDRIVDVHSHLWAADWLPEAWWDAHVDLVVREFVDALGADRVHFDTDDPVFDPAFPKEEWVERIRGLADREADPTFSAEEVASLLGGGAERLLDG